MARNDEDYDSVTGDYSGPSEAVAKPKKAPKPKPSGTSGAAAAKKKPRAKQSREDDLDDLSSSSSEDDSSDSDLASSEEEEKPKKGSKRAAPKAAEPKKKPHKAKKQRKEESSEDSEVEIVEEPPKKPITIKKVGVLEKRKFQHVKKAFLGLRADLAPLYDVGKFLVENKVEKRSGKEPAVWRAELKKQAEEMDPKVREELEGVYREARALFDEAKVEFEARKKVWVEENKDAIKLGEIAAEIKQETRLTRVNAATKNGTYRRGLSKKLKDADDIMAIVIADAVTEMKSRVTSGWQQVMGVLSE